MRLRELFIDKYYRSMSFSNISDDFINQKEANFC